MNRLAIALTSLCVALALAPPMASAQDNLPAQPAPEVAKETAKETVKPAAAANGHKPIIYINISIRKQRAAVLAAWDAGLGRPTDFVCSCPGEDNRGEIAKVKVGTHAWMSISPKKLKDYARTADETDKTVQWLWYNIEEGWPQAERNNAIKAMKELHAMCAKRGWKFGVITDEQDKLMSYVPCVDGIIFECQKNLDAKRARFMRNFAVGARKLNPNCLVGAQLGVGVPNKGYGGTDKAMAFYKATQDSMDFYSVWWGTPETMIAFLEKLNK